MNNEAQTKVRSLRTLRLGTPGPSKAEGYEPIPISERHGPPSRMRPEAPVFMVTPEAPACAHATVAVDEREPKTRRLRTPIDEVNDVLRRMEIRELGDVLLYAHRLLAARGQVPDPAVISSVLSAMGRLWSAYRSAPGVPLPILRGALVDVPRRTLDEALVEAEGRRLIKLVPVSPLTPFIEKAAGIHDSRRGLLYYCSAP
jgi:hypothetical protein